MSFKNLISVIGLILCALGLLLPWGELSLIPGVMTESRCILGIQLGIQLPLGQFTFMGLAVAAFFQILYTVKNRRYFLIFIMSGGAAVIVFSSIWVINPGALTLAPGPYLYKALYGAYLSLVGGILILLGGLTQYVDP